jgi:hypothetical protein
MPKGGQDKKAGDSENPNALSSPEGHTEFLEALRRIVRELQLVTYSPLRRSRECLQRIREGTRPQERSVRRLLKEIWDPFAPKAASNPPLNPNVCPALEAFRSRVPGQWNRENFVDWFVAEFERERGERKKQRRRKRSQTAPNSAGSRNPGVEEILSPVPKEVTEAVDAFVRQAGIDVINGNAVLDSKYIVQLGPLHRYVERLLVPVIIPSYFSGAPGIPIDELYVELSASTERREALTQEIERREEEGWSRVDPTDPNHFARWARIEEGQRIPPEELLRTTASNPAVVFGDPGSGKSTLTRHILHEVGKGIVGRSSGLGVQALPFRIALRDFAAKANPRKVSILRHVVRHELGIRKKRATRDWVGFLSHLADNRKPFRLLFLVDGIDELSPGSAIHGAMQQAWADIISISRIVFTSRRAGFQRPVPRFDAFELVPLSEIPAQKLIWNWFQAVGRADKDFIQSFTDWVFADSRRQEMTGNPSLLTLLCFLNMDKDKDRFLQASSRANLYALAVEKLMEDAPRVGNSDLSWALPPLEDFAFSRYSESGDGPAALFKRPAVLRHLQRHVVCQANEGRTPQATLRAWMDMRLVFQWNVGVWHHFIHLTFLEYFAARALSSRPRDEVCRLLDQHRFNPYWREVWRFYAGICTDLGREGAQRFEDMAQALTKPEDVFGEVPFFLAPLCCEFNLRETSKVLGYDLRLRLLEIAQARHRTGMDSAHEETSDADWRREIQDLNTFADASLVARVRAMVELDPQFYLAFAKGVLDRATAVPPNRKSLPEKARFEILWALLVLNCICHPDALDYHRALLRREMSWKRLPLGFPLLGPRLATGRNESLCAEMERLDVGSLSPEHQERVLRYLSCTRSPRAIPFIQQIADSASSKGERESELRYKCLEAYCDLQDRAAIPLAASLSREDGFREVMMAEVSVLLSKIRNPEVPVLLEEWLGSDYSKWDDHSYIILIEALRHWDSRPLPKGVYEALLSPGSSFDLRRFLWNMVLVREGVLGLGKLKEWVFQQLRRPELNESDCDELVALLGLICQEQIMDFEFVESVADRIPVRFASHRAVALASLVSLHLLQCNLPESESWVLRIGVPLFQKELQRCVLSGARPCEIWLKCWEDAPPSVLSALREVVLKFWKRMDPKDAASVFAAFVSKPDLIPIGVAQSLLESEATELLRVGVELLLKLDPGLLMRRRDDERIETQLRDASVKGGILFFEDRLYSPLIPGFVEYSKA